MPNSAVKFGGLAAGPGNGLEKLSRPRAGPYSIRIDDQRRRYAARPQSQ